MVNLLKDGNCLNKGYHIFFDNSFSSVDFVRYLYSTESYVTGTIRRSKRCIPDYLKKANMNEVKYFRNNEVFCAYCERKSVKNPVLLISTKIANQNVMITKRQHDRKMHSTKAAIIQSYNTYMDDVDELDKILCTYLDEPRTVKYWKKVTFSIISRMVLNTYIIYEERVNGKAMNRIDFISNTIFEIECDEGKESTSFSTW